MIEKMEKVLRTWFPKNKAGERFAGGVLVFLLVGIWTGGSVLLLSLAYQTALWMGILCESWMCYRMLAMKSLRIESQKVYDGLSVSLEKGRYALSRIVGRDTEKLSEEGVIKGAVETVAENTSDGVVAPLFYMLFFGGVGGVLYKAVNTLDSMIGYKNEAYQYFGTAAAKLDDILNFLPARISALLMLWSAFFLQEDWKQGWKIYQRDKRNHGSPNAGHTEAVMAGVLQVELAGDAYYFGKLQKKPTIGSPIRRIERQDILKSHTLLYGTGLWMLLLVILVRGILWKFGVWR